MKTSPTLHVAVALASLTALLPACGDERILPNGVGGGSSSTSTSVGASTSSGTGGAASTWDWHLPLGVPNPRVPADNPMSAAKVELGRRLFYDKRLSDNLTYACATCHLQEKAFTDGLAHAIGSTKQVHPRGSMSIVNVAYASRLTWANPLIESLEQQARLPMFGETPVELGLAGKEQELFDRLGAEPVYQMLFPEAFPEEKPAISLVTVTRAIGAFERTVMSFRSPYDRYAYGGDKSGMSDAALRGRDLFFSDKLECFHCHGSFDLSDSVVHEGSTFVEVEYHNTGLYNLDGKGAYPADNTGVFAITAVPADMGRFRAPTLRNIALTAPYMHDGSVATLEDALDHYAAGGRTIASGPDAGDGSKSPLKSELINGFTLTPGDKSDVVEFLKSLTDQELLKDPTLSDPWVKTP
jgi:cytochrome c peroxidase